MCVTGYLDLAYCGLHYTIHAVVCARGLSVSYCVGVCAMRRTSVRASWDHPRARVRFFSPRVASSRARARGTRVRARVRVDGRGGLGIARARRGEARRRVVVSLSLARVVERGGTQTGVFLCRGVRA